MTPVLDSAVEHYARQQRLTAAAVLAVQREWKRGPLAVAQVLTAFQILAARDAADSVPLMLEEQHIDAPAAGAVVATSVAGVASDGRPLDTLTDLAATYGQAWLGLVAATQVQDAARSASGLSIAARPRVGGWVRMMNPPSCSRCAVLAGKWFRWNQGFQRHPRCDCRHIPSQEADYSDPRLSGDKWFHTLSPAEQDRIFTKAGAQAVRDGADLNQVVNARRGMAKAQVYGKPALITREGITVRGQYGRLRGDAVKQRGQRYRATKHVRLMPESIYDAAIDRADAIRLLKLHGFIV